MQLVLNSPLEIVFTAIYFILPAYFANMCPVLFGKLNLPLGKPINEKLFGSHKTWRGFYAGYIGALIILFLQYYLQTEGVFWIYKIIDYSLENIFLFAFIFGIGAIFGDLLKSFFKRRIGIKPGAPWFPFDQIDLVLGAFLFLLPFFIPPWEIFVALLIVTPILHFLTNLVAYLIGLKKVWW